MAKNEVDVLAFQASGPLPQGEKYAFVLFKEGPQRVEIVYKERRKRTVTQKSYPLPPKISEPKFVKNKSYLPGFKPAGTFAVFSCPEFPSSFFIVWAKFRVKDFPETAREILLFPQVGDKKIVLGSNHPDGNFHFEQGVEYEVVFSLFNGDGRFLGGSRKYQVFPSPMD